MDWLLIQQLAMAFALLFPIYSAIQAYYRASLFHMGQLKIEEKNILIVIAHPDDEAMFFVPTIRRLRGANKLYLLCLSNGDADGLGKIREKELVKSCKYLGFTGQPEIVSDNDLQDGMKVNWPQGVVAEQVARYFRASSVKFDVMVTFDD